MVAKVRVKRGGKSMWIEPEDLREGEATFPLRPTTRVRRIAASDPTTGQDWDFLAVDNHVVDAALAASSEPVAGIDTPPVPGGPRDPADLEAVRQELVRKVAELQALEASLQPPAPPKRPSVYPVVYYNPMVPDERFRVGDSARFVKFFWGTFQVKNPTEEASVRAVLQSYGANKPDRWKGNTGDYQFVCGKTDCRFTTRNTDAWSDHRKHKQGHGEGA